jgi:UDP-glucose:(heptosyl)LPS alpha-1,3-glucosyltransferase
MVKHDIIRHYRVNSEKISVVYSGVDDDINMSTAGSVRQKYNIPESVPLVLYVGSGFERKGVAEMLALLARVESPFFTLVVGKDKRMKKYRDLCQQLGLDERVKFTGAVTDVDPYYVDSDILMLPTRYEPFSNVVLEAMRGGNAVITTLQNGAAEILQAELLMQTSDDEGILPALEKLLNQPDYLSRIKESNRKTVAEYTMERNAAETIALIEQTLRQGNQSD